MRIEQLEYFLTIYRVGSISKAADMLYMSQSALSETLLNLEKELNFPLFARSSKGVTLTEDGEIFLEYAQQIMQCYISMQKRFKKKQMQCLDEQGLPPLRLACTPLAAQAGILESFQKAYPKIIIQYYEADIKEIAAHLIANPKFLGIGFSREDSIKNLQVCAVLEKSPLVACVAMDSPLANKKAIAYADTEKYDTVVFESPFSYDSFFLERSIVISNSVEVQNKLITQEQYVGFAPESIYTKFFDHTKMKALPITPKVVLTNCILSQNGKELTETEHLFIEFAKKLVKYGIPV